MELNPCPFCGSDDLSEIIVDNIDYAQIRCADCHAAGPVADLVGDYRRAAAAWNRAVRPAEGQS